MEKTIKPRKMRISVLMLILVISISQIFIEGINCRQHTTSNDYYEILEIKRDASKADIKKKYRELSKIYHPDKNQGDQDSGDHYKKINRAYEVLSDENRRQMFDQQGHDGVDRYESGQHQIKKGPNARADVSITLKEMYLGTKRKMNINRNIYCDPCRGTGAKGGDLKKCAKCKGQGVVLQMVNVGMGMQMQMQQHCDKCKGKGQTMAAKCPKCRGKRLTQESKLVELDFPAGTQAGDTTVLNNEAEQVPDLARGDLIFTVKQKGTSPFKRIGVNLYYEMPISLEQSLLGFSKEITHLDGHIVKVFSDPNEIQQPDSWKIIPGEGMPIKHSGGSFGDLHVRMKVKLPAKLSEKQIQLIGSILPEQ